MIDGGRRGGRCGRQRQLVATDDGNWKQLTAAPMAVGGRQWWTAVINGGGRRQQMIYKVNRERINWCEVRRIIVRRYKIKGEKIRMK